MALQALLLSNDPEVHRTIRRVLDAANIDLDLSNNADQARHILLRRKYDALLVDCDDMPHGPLVLRELRLGKSNKSCIAFAVVNGKTNIQQAFEMGANFVLDKPISLDRATRSVRAAQGLIMRERRRYHRHLVKATGAILVDQGAELPLNITNISHGGISIECSRRLDEGGAARVEVATARNQAFVGHQRRDCVVHAGRPCRNSLSSAVSGSKERAGYLAGEAGADAGWRSNVHQRHNSLGS